MEIVTLAVTRSGFGAAWRFEDRYAALRHPLVQPGDAVMDEAADLLRLYSPGQLIKLCSSQGLGALVGRVESRLLELGAMSSRLLVEALERDYLHEEIWAALDGQAAEPPQDPVTLLNLIQSDRDSELLERRMAKTEKTPAADPKPAKETKVPTIKGVDGADLPMTTRLTFGTYDKNVPAVKDKEGKETKPASVVTTKYDIGENNPKSRGAGERFAKYKHNMTFQQAVDSGVNGADIAWDLKKGFIVVNAATK